MRIDQVEKLLKENNDRFGVNFRIYEGNFPKSVTRILGSTSGIALKPSAVIAIKRDDQIQDLLLFDDRKELAGYTVKYKGSKDENVSCYYVPAKRESDHVRASHYVADILRTQEIMGAEG